MTPLPTFDGPALMRAVDDRRIEQTLSWTQLAEHIWDESADLNAELDDNSLCPGALVRTAKRGTMSCQYALVLLRYLDRAPEEFLTGDVVDVGDTRLPDAGPDVRLRWDLANLHTELDAHRQQRHLTWTALAADVGCSPSRLTNLRTARLADIGLTMQLTQLLGRPAAAFVRPERW